MIDVVPMHERGHNDPVAIGRGVVVPVVEVAAAAAGLVATGLAKRLGEEAADYERGDKR